MNLKSALLGLGGLVLQKRRKRGVRDCKFEGVDTEGHEEAYEAVKILKEQAFFCCAGSRRRNRTGAFLFSLLVAGTPYPGPLPLERGAEAKRTAVGLFDFVLPLVFVCCSLFRCSFDL